MNFYLFQGHKWLGSGCIQWGYPFEMSHYKEDDEIVNESTYSKSESEPGLLPKSNTNTSVLHSPRPNTEMTDISTLNLFQVYHLQQ